MCNEHSALSHGRSVRAVGWTRVGSRPTRLPTFSRRSRRFSNDNGGLRLRLRDKSRLSRLTARESFAAKVWIVRTAFCVSAKSALLIFAPYRRTIGRAPYASSSALRSLDCGDNTWILLIVVKNRTMRTVACLLADSQHFVRSTLYPRPSCLRSSRYEGS